MDDIVGKVMSIILAFLLLGIAPMYYTSIIEVNRDQVTLMLATRNFMDTVIDNRELTEDMLEDFYAEIASVNGYYDVKITHKVKMINPDPMVGGTATYTTYVVVDDLYNYERGDEICVTVKPLGLTYYQKVARDLFGINVTHNGFTFAGKVR